MEESIHSVRIIKLTAGDLENAIRDYVKSNGENITVIFKNLQSDLPRLITLHSKCEIRVELWTKES